MRRTRLYVAPDGACAVIAAASPLELSDSLRIDKLSECAPDFRRAFCARVRKLRTAAGVSRAEMASLLDVTPAAYESYETRTLLPHRLVGQFCAVTGANFGELFHPPPGWRR